MNTGKAIRLNRIFGKEKKTFIVAVDHPLFGEVKGLERLRALVEDLIAGGVDGFLANPGTIKNIFSKISDISLIMTVPYLKGFAKEAARIGVNGIKTSYFGNPKLNDEIVEKISMLALEAEEWGIPYILELEPQDENRRTIYDIDAIKLMARIGAELGADVLKMPYVPPAEKYKEVIESCGVPVVIRGGEKMSNAKDFIETIWEAREAGASGAIIGRNIWEASNPRVMASVVWRLIYGKIDVKNALNEILVD